MTGQFLFWEEPMSLIDDLIVTVTSAVLAGGRPDCASLIRLVARPHATSRPKLPSISHICLVFGDRDGSARAGLAQFAGDAGQHKQHGEPTTINKTFGATPAFTLDQVTHDLAHAHGGHGR
jgi:hypothetical protein